MCEAMGINWCGKVHNMTLTLGYPKQKIKL